MSELAVAGNSDRRPMDQRPIDFVEVVEIVGAAEYGKGPCCLVVGLLQIDRGLTL